MSISLSDGDCEVIDAARIHSFGAEPVVDKVSEPESENDAEVVVDVILSSLNPLDLWVAEGSVAGGSQSLPFILGCEALGTLEGRRVIVNGAGVGTMRSGVHARRAAVPIDAVLSVPDDVPDTQAATVAIAGVTARRVLEVASLQAGESVLVLGASGGVGSVTLQIARRLGANVIAVTSSSVKKDFLSALGVSTVIVSDLSDLSSDLRLHSISPPDVVVNPLGGPSVALGVDILRPGGRQVVLGRSAGDLFSVSAANLYRNNISIIGYGGLVDSPEAKQSAMAWLFQAIAAGEVTIPVEREVALPEFPSAFQMLKDASVTGKVVVRM